MRYALAQFCARIALVLLVAFSLLLSGFAHRPALMAGPMAQPAPAQAAYLADMGLTLADLCVEPGAAGDDMATGDCPACHLAGSILLPQPVAHGADIELRSAAAILVPAQTRGLGRSTNPATPVRAPPLA
ncbi:hypothetical protein [Gemmobacter denitrificans]|uniref:DUF2946 domain-containing protein n=1 Tax=Gemmobacter denitrificans TaxID=3123040 RepID=A0ABU8BZ13_9RHOB